MMIVGRGIAGFAAGGEYPGRPSIANSAFIPRSDKASPVCGTSSAEASDESAYVRKRRGILVAMSTDFAIDFVGAPKLTDICIFESKFTCLFLKF